VIARVTVEAVVRRLSRPLATARGVIRLRIALRVSLLGDDGRIGHGEASPLPGFAAGDLAMARRDLASAAEGLPGRSPEEAARWIATEVRDPTAAWALDAARCELAALRADLPLAKWLAADAACAVPTNALLTADDPQALEAEAAAALARGEHTLKLKVGAEEASRDVERARAVRRVAGPGVRLRLDANGAWDEAEARRRLARLAFVTPQWVEQPVPPGDPEALARARHVSPVPVAADEGVRSLEDARRHLALGACDALVLKPAALGVLDVTRRIVAEADAAGVRVVVTSLLDGARSQLAALQLAASLRLSAACGLGGLLEDDDVVFPEAEKGCVVIPPGPGLGSVATEDAW
jgi:o-succinylbenzoate synthase